MTYSWSLLSSKICLKEILHIKEMCSVLKFQKVAFKGFVFRRFHMTLYFSSSHMEVYVLNFKIFTNLSTEGCQLLVSTVEE